MSKPKVKLLNRDGNAYNILGRCKQAADKVGWSKEKWDNFSKEAESGDYNHLLQIAMKYFDVR